MAGAKPVTGVTRSYTQFCDHIAETHGLGKVKAKELMNDAFAFIQKSLMAGDNVMTPLGKFRRADRVARMGRNPQTGESIKIKAKKAVKFAPNKALKEAMG